MVCQVLLHPWYPEPSPAGRSRGYGSNQGKQGRGTEPIWLLNDPTFMPSGGYPEGAGSVLPWMLFDPGSAWLNLTLAWMCNHLGALPIDRPGSYPFHPALGHLSAEQKGLCLPAGPGPGGLQHPRACRVPGCPRTLRAPGPGRRWLSHVFCVGFLPLLESPSAERWG